MSRRKAFETSLSSSSNPQNANGPSGTVNRQGTGQKQSNGAGGKTDTGANARAARVPPAISLPDPSVGAAAVPTETNGEKGKAMAKAPSPVPLAEEGEGEENELCFICAEPVTFYSVGVCGHRTCQYVCSFLGPR